MTPENTLSVVIGTRNRLDILRRCLGALLGKIECSHEIVVADAGSTDGSLEYLRSLEGVTLAEDGELIGQAQSLNRVAKCLKGKYLCWLSDDNVVRPGMLDEAVGILENAPGIGMVSLKVKDVTGPHTEEAYMGGIWPSGVLNVNQGMLPLALYREVGGFDESFRDYGIDGDLTTKVLLAGYKVVFTRAVAVDHYRMHEGNSWVEPEERRKRIDAMRGRYAEKFPALVAAADALPFRLRRRAGSIILRLMAAPSKGKRAAARDLHNFFSSPWISPANAMKASGTPYHLVQELPERLRIPQAGPAVRRR